MTLIDIKSCNYTGRTTSRRHGGPTQYRTDIVANLMKIGIMIPDRDQILVLL